jgi:hypothetical protein
MILLTNPHKQVVVVVVEHTTAIRPVTAHARCKKQCGVWLLEEVATLPQRFFLLLAHASWLRSIRLAAVQREVITLQVSFHGKQSLDTQSLKLATVIKADGWRQLEALDTTTSAHTSGEHILALWVNVGV